jgi:hypothetical protein
MAKGEIVDPGANMKVDPGKRTLKGCPVCEGTFNGQIDHELFECLCWNHLMELLEALLRIGSR